jgi:ribosomal protein S18 acetylase RimI-like enzyme
MTISEANRMEDAILAAFQRLMPQLSANHPPPSAAALQALIDSPSRLLLARDNDGRIVGTATLSVFWIPSGLRCRIEDVIVDQDVRGQGVGARLTEEALSLAREMGAPGVDLTSNSQREAANRLYRRLGFQTRETNLYRYQF